MNDPAAFTSLIIALIAFLAGVVVGRLYGRVVADEEGLDEGLRICCNPDCGWVGLEGDCVYSGRTSRIGDDRLCPKCYEVTEASE